MKHPPIKEYKILITEADKNDLKEILQLQKLSFKQYAQVYNDYNMPPLQQTYKEILNEYDEKIFLKAVENNKIIGSVRAYKKDGTTCYIGRLIVHPLYQNRGIGKKLMQMIEDKFSEVKRYELFTGNKSKKNLYLYNKLGYKVYKKEKLSESVSLIYLEK